MVHGPKPSFKSNSKTVSIVSRWQYLAEQRGTAAEELLHAGELLCSFDLQSNIWQPTAGQSLHGGTVGDGCAVQRSHT